MSLANVIKPSSGLPKYVHKDFPALMWKPDGTTYVAASAADVLPDSTPFHPSNAPTVKPAAQATTGPTLTKEETVEQLKAGGIAHNPAASHSKLYNLLLNGVKAALVQADIVFDETTTDVKALLALLPSE